MASSYNQRSGSSGSNAPKKTSVSKNSNNRAGLNRSKAGYYAQGSRKSAQGESFESRAARKRIASLPHTNDPLQMSSSNRTFTAKKTGQAHFASVDSSGLSRPSRKTKVPASQLSGPARQSRKMGSSPSPTHAAGRLSRAGTNLAGYSNAKKTAEPSRAVGRTIGDIKASKPVPSFFDVNRHIITRLGLVCGIIAAAVVLFAVLYHLPVLKIDNVTVSNNNYLSTQTVLDLAEVPDNATLLNPGTQGIQERVTSNPWVDSVHVRRVFPTGIEIVVYESAIAATVDVPVTLTVPTQTVWALSADGVWLGRVVDVPEPATATDADGSQTTTTGTTATAAPTTGTAAPTTKPVSEEELRIATAAEECPSIADVTSSINPVAGEACTDEGVLNALAIISKSSEDFSSQIDQISAPSVEKTVLLLKNGVTVAFGSASDLTSKERVINQLLSEHEGNISYINVRVVDRPAWRGLV